MHANALKVLSWRMADGGVGIYLFGDRGHLALLDTSTDARQAVVQVCSQGTSQFPGTVWHGC